MAKRTRQNPTMNRGGRRCFGRVSRFCSTCGARRITLFTYHIIRHEWGKDGIVQSGLGDRLQGKTFTLILPPSALCGDPNSRFKTSN